MHTCFRVPSYSTRYHENGIIVAKQARWNVPIFGLRLSRCFTLGPSCPRSLEALKSPFEHLASTRCGINFGLERLDETEEFLFPDFLMPERVHENAVWPGKSGFKEKRGRNLAQEVESPALKKCIWEEVE